MIDIEATYGDRYSRSDYHFQQVHFWVLVSILNLLNLRRRVIKILHFYLCLRFCFGVDVGARVDFLGRNRGMTVKRKRLSLRDRSWMLLETNYCRARSIDQPDRTPKLYIRLEGIEGEEEVPSFKTRFLKQPSCV